MLKLTKPFILIIFILFLSFTAPANGQNYPSKTDYKQSSPKPLTEEEIIIQKVESGTINNSKVKEERTKKNKKRSVKLDKSYKKQYNKESPKRNKNKQKKPKRG